MTVEHHVRVRNIKITTLSQPDKVADIDCRGCSAPCCKGMRIPLLTEEEFLSGKYPIRVVNIPELKKKVPNAENVIGLAVGKDGCFFLKNNECSIYDERPKACQVYDCREDTREDIVEFVKKRFVNV